jgi:hypothetical protein
MQFLCGPEHVPLEAVRNHEVVADGNCEHADAQYAMRCVKV